MRHHTTPGFVSGVGFGTVLPEMWPLIRSLVDVVITVSLAEVASAIKVMVENNRVVAEGAGAIPVAAALSGRYEYSRVCGVEYDFAGWGAVAAVVHAGVAPKSDARERGE